MLQRKIPTKVSAEVSNIPTEGAVLTGGGRQTYPWLSSG